MRQLTYSFTKVAPLCFTGCFMMLPLSSALHPWVPPPCSPEFLHVPPHCVSRVVSCCSSVTSTLLPGVPPPCSPEFLHLPPRSSSTFLPGAAPPSSLGLLHLPPWGCSTLLPGVPPPSSPLCFTGCFMLFHGDLHFAPLGSPTLHPWGPPPSSLRPSVQLPTVLSYWLRCVEMSGIVVYERRKTATL